MEYEEYSPKTWKKHPLNPKTANEEAVEWIFIVDLLNFCFWTRPVDKDKEFAVTYKGTKYTGYWSLCACINRALDEGIQITTPEFYSRVTFDQVSYIFRPDDEHSEPMKMLAERHSILNTTGKILVQNFGGKFLNMLKKAENSSLTLIDLLVNNIPSFNDSIDYMGNELSFYKRAQIVVADIWACFENTGLGYFFDIDSLTMFADYRVPQVLVYLGILKYSPKLLNLLESAYFGEHKTSESDLVSHGDRYEIEIRGNSILAVELLKQAIKAELQAQSNLNSIMLDFFLWDYAKKNSASMAHIPIHLTKSVFY
ncbi:hypothetical protein BB560_000284 [Smittium megazygosporum]|uniref:Queuosine 5'-phosphate N-glycosylase/hydrolase n=1 Tax=Smittium megazygosporum TaxID=133381 RepID=A0A2T9ZKW1_9FUNG|nr:hypothetical protein BB560_000284 [Smittium megazygosporum]